MSKLDEPDRAEAGAHTLEAAWDVFCPEDNEVVMPAKYEIKQKAEQAAKAHNAEFSPKHHARVRPHEHHPEDP
ncbi:hypothetical protein ACIGFK_04395 [Streptomyces sp. NPDC085524]|uniref:hypothetical protein n=1 Tax=unclassified Streptomyces TaxID=2593676 RepID=UPI0035DC9664